MADVGIFPFYKTVKDVHATKNVQLDDVGHGIDPNKQLFWLLDRDANEIDGLNFQYGEGTDVSAACATSFKGEMYLFGGYFIKDQVRFRRNSPEILSDDFR